MIRALYTAASGMNAQQANIDNIANNLANVNTTGFKKSRVEFEDLVYQQTKAAGSPTSTTGEAPIGLEFGLGTRPVATARDFQHGEPAVDERTHSTWPSKARGFLQVTMPDGHDRLHARRLAPPELGRALVTERGLPDSSRRSPSRRTPRPISISKDGIVSVAIQGQTAPQQVGTIELATFQNPAGLKAVGGNLFRQHDGVGRTDDRRCRASTASARSRRGSSRNPTSAWSRRWST